MHLQIIGRSRYGKTSLSLALHCQGTNGPIPNAVQGLSLTEPDIDPSGSAPEGCARVKAPLRAPLIGYVMSSDIII